jgi:moderate conductance mechanosensitive channel
LIHSSFSEVQLLVSALVYDLFTKNPSAQPGPTPTPDLQEKMVRTTTGVGDYFSKHGDALLRGAAEIIGIMIVALIIRKLTLTMITRTIERAATRAESKPGRFLEGSLLMGVERRHQRTRALGAVLRSAASVTIMVIALLMVITVLNIPTGPILASVGVLSAAIGFGARDVVTDLLSGIFMIMEDQFGVGDTIDAGDAKGTVEDVGLRVTQLRDVDGVVWYVRNGAVKRIGNLSQGHSRAVVDVPVAYSEDVAQVREIMTTTAVALFEDPAWSDRFPAEAPTVAGIESIEGDHLMMRVTVRTVPQKNFEVARELRMRLKSALDAAGIQVAPRNGVS